METRTPWKHELPVGRPRPRQRVSRVARAFLLCTCCRHYPGTATGGPALLIHPVVSVFPGMAAGSTRAFSFSRLTQRSLTLRPAHSRCHRISWHALPEGFNHFVSSMIAPVASGWSGLPGGICTHRKAPPLHGARHKRRLAGSQRQVTQPAEISPASLQTETAQDA